MNDVKEITAAGNQKGVGDWLMDCLLVPFALPASILDFSCPRLLGVSFCRTYQAPYMYI